MFSRPEAIALYNKGCAAMAEARYADAAGFFRGSLAAEPGVVAAQFNFAVALQCAGDLAGALAGFQRCLCDHPGHIDSAYNLGCAYELSGDPAAAAEAFRACLRLSPGHRDSSFNLATCLQQTGDVAGAIESYRALLARHPDDLAAGYNMACLQQEAGALADAIAAYRTCLTQKPDHRQSAFNLAACLQVAGDEPAAIEAYRSCLARHPDYAEAAENLGALLQQAGDMAGAIAVYRRALLHNAERRETAFNLATALQRCGDTDAAMAVYRDCATRHPDNPDAGANLAALLVSCGRAEEAVALLSELVARFPAETDLSWNLALAKWRAHLAAACRADAGQKHRRILIACMPKSGSTFLTDVVAKLPGMQRAHLVPDYGRREQELDLEQLIGYQGLSYVSQLHLRPSNLTRELLQAFGIQPLFLFRNIWDVLASLRDHMNRHSLDWSMAQIDPDFRSWEEGRQYDFLARAMMPWFVDFYVSWSREPGCLAVRYEDLMADPVAAVGRIGEWAGIAAGPEEIAAALAAVGHSVTFNKGGSGRGAAVPASARAHVEALTGFYPDVDFAPLLGD